MLYRGRELRHHQFHVATDWPGGLYYSPALAGSRPGGLVAGAWAAMLSMGEEGYLRATRSILETAATIRTGIEAVPELRVIGEPLWVIAFTSDTLDIYELEVDEAPNVRVDDREVVRAEFHTPDEALGMQIVPHLEEYLTQRISRAAG